MWRAITASLILLATAEPSSAWHWHWHRHHHHRHHHSSEPGDRPDGRAEATRNRTATAEFVPSGWTLAPPDPKWTGKRFVSPDGQAWFAAYSSGVAQEAVPAHMREVAFVDGETPTFIRGESDRIAVAGTKGDRMFYRKAVIACGGRTWHHIAFEYPIALSRHVEPMLRRAEKAVDASENDGCDTPPAATPSVQAKPAETTGAAPKP